MNFKTKTTPGFSRFPNATGESDIVHTAARRLWLEQRLRSCSYPV